MGAMKERMLRGELYRPDDPELPAGQARCARLLDRYNATGHDEQAEREALLRELLGSVGEGVVVKPAFRCDYGANITIGDGTFLNFDCVMLDIAPIALGAPCWLATQRPAARGHPSHRPVPRRDGWEYGAPITHRRQRVARRRRHRLPRRHHRRATPWSAPARWSRATSRPASSRTATPRA